MAAYRIATMNDDLGKFGCEIMKRTSLRIFKVLVKFDSLKAEIINELVITLPSATNC